jgi:DNA-binding beta-propeller fold protein YncE
VSLNNLLAVVVAGVACIVPAIQTRADTIFVDCPLEGTIHEYTTNGVGSIFTRQSIAAPQGEAFDQAGNLYIANEAFNTIEKFTPNRVASLFAADPGDFSVLDSPEGLAFDKAGNLYVANDSSSTIEKFDTNGVASVFAADDGSGTILAGPEGLAFDAAGNLYVANDNNFIEKFSPGGTPLGNFGDSSFLISPVGVVFDTAGNLYVANGQPADSNPTIAKFDKNGNGSVFFTGGGLDVPEFLAFDTYGNLYVSDSGVSNNIVKIDTSGHGSVLIDSAIQEPLGLAFDSAEYLYVANNGNFIQEFDTNGNNLFRFANPSLSDPQQMGFDSAGNLYVVNLTFGSIEKFDTNAVASVFAFPGGNPVGLAVDGSDNIYVTASFFNQILKYAPNGSSTVFATDDGTGNILNNPQDLAIDSLGNLYTINGNDNSISEFDPSGHFTDFAPYYDFYTHGPGLAVDSANHVYSLTNFTEIAKFSTGGVPSPFANDPVQNFGPLTVDGMAFDSAGNLYVANYYDGTIEKFDPNGNGTIFASGLLTPTDITIRRGSGSPIPFIPTLAIKATAANAVLSWSTAATGYNLHSTTNLLHPNWQLVSGTIYTNGSSLVLTNGLGGSVRFFRLSNP